MTLTRKTDAPKPNGAARHLDPRSLPLEGRRDGETAIQCCVRMELERYFELLDGEPPDDLYRLVMQQVESVLLESVLRECGGNRSKAAAWLGITRNTLRAKLPNP